MIIHYYIKKVYGKPCRYVLDTEKARQILFLTGRKTITEAEQIAITNLSDGQIRWVQCLPPNS